MKIKLIDFIYTKYLYNIDSEHVVIKLKCYKYLQKEKKNKKNNYTKINK